MGRWSRGGPAPPAPRCAPRSASRPSGRGGAHPAGTVSLSGAELKPCCALRPASKHPEQIWDGEWGESIYI